LQSEANGKLTEVSAVETPAAPSGHVGLSPDRDEQGRWRKGNRAAVVVGERSLAFWAAHDATRREIVQSVLTDAGHLKDAPRALQLAANGVAQAAILRDAAYDRMLRDGGPLSSAGRPRRAYQVWLTAIDRLEKHLRLVGLTRRVQDVGSMNLRDYLATQRETTGEGTDR
jgi:hypothetical protein